MPHPDLVAARVRRLSYTPPKKASPFPLPVSEGEGKKNNKIIAIHKKGIVRLVRLARLIARTRD